MTTLIFLLGLAVYGEVAATEMIVKKGENVTLHNDIRKDSNEEVVWYFNDIRIAVINTNPSMSCLYDGEGGIFKDKLVVYNDNGSLTIKHIRPEHAGRYEAEYSKGGPSNTITLNRQQQGNCNSTAIYQKGNISDDIKKTVNVKVNGVVGAEVIEKKEGETVTLLTNFTKETNEEVVWYFNDIRIAVVNDNASTSCMYDGEGGIFKDKLEPNNKTGSLTIKDIRPEHAGRYEAEYSKGGNSKNETLRNIRLQKCDRTAIIRKEGNQHDIIKTFEVKVTGPPSGLSAGAIAGICVGVVVVFLLAIGVAVVLIYRQLKKLERDMNICEKGLLQDVNE